MLFWILAGWLGRTITDLLTGFTRIAKSFSSHALDQSIVDFPKVLIIAGGVWLGVTIKQSDEGGRGGQVIFRECGGLLVMGQNLTEILH